MTPDEVQQRAQEYEERSPQAILRFAFETIDGLALAFSGAEDVALVAMAKKIEPKVSVFCLDTGRLHGETYRFIEEVRKRFDLEIEMLFPDAARVEELVKKKGLFSFYEDGHQECCSIRKVEPLSKKLRTLSGWITGQRRDQNPDTRARIPVIEVDRAFSSVEKTLVKLNPLAAWTSAQVWDYIRAEELPYNELHGRGFLSIGCEPCTRAVLPGEAERAGRWWWEQAQHKECGLHAANLERAPSPDEV
jgi:phosphoadenosine phosphosulfate reductase